MKYEHTEIVVGSSLSALLFACSNGHPILFTEPQKPFRFDYFTPEVDLSCLKIPAAQKSLTTFKGKKQLGIQKEILWERLLFLLSLDGGAPLSNLCSSIRCSENKIICSNEYSKIAEIEFDVCHYFYDKNAFGFAEEKEVDTDKYICYDWVAFNRGGKHNIDYIETGDNLANQIWFYPSDRIDGDTPVKDACIISTLDAKQVEHFDYSETMARFKLEHEMTSRGMKGPSNGYGPNGKPKHYKFRTTSTSRTTHRTNRKLKEASDSVKIAFPDKAQLLEDLQKISVGYDRLLRWL
jgi:hypothetical protein